MLLARSTVLRAARRAPRGGAGGGARGRSAASGEAGERAPRVFVIDRGKKVEQKVCVVCDRPFTWRKKWERSWDEITTCSKRCNSERRRLARVARKARGRGGPVESGAVVESGSISVEDKSKVARKARKKAAKALRRKVRAGIADASVGQKECTTCKKQCDLLIRCRIDTTRKWHMVCGKCWHVHSGGVPDGSAKHPNYQYGGLWKNLVKL